VFQYAPTRVLYTRSLHDALPISRDGGGVRDGDEDRGDAVAGDDGPVGRRVRPGVLVDVGPAHGMVVLSAGSGFSRCQPRTARKRSEEHTSELQSRENLVCRLLLE